MHLTRLQERKLKYQNGITFWPTLYVPNNKFEFALRKLATIIRNKAIREIQIITIISKKFI